LGGVTIPGFGRGPMLSMMAGPWLLYIATISGPQFELIFPPREAAKEREKAEQRFEESKTVDDALKLDLARLNEYYVINQNQARASFRWAVFSMLIGFGTIITGIWFFYIHDSHSDTLMASLSTAAGVVVNFIAALFLRLHSMTQARSRHYYDQLARLQLISIAIRLVDSQEDSSARQDTRNLVIRELLSTTRPKLPNQLAKPIVATDEQPTTD
jgi:cation transport ATPase